MRAASSCSSAAIMTGAPIDVLIQTDIEGHGRLEPSIETVIIARSGMRPAPDFGKDLTHVPPLKTADFSTPQVNTCG